MEICQVTDMANAVGKSMAKSVATSLEYGFINVIVLYIYVCVVIYIYIYMIYIYIHTYIHTYIHVKPPVHQTIRLPWGHNNHFAVRIDTCVAQGPNFQERGENRKAICELGVFR